MLHYVFLKQILQDITHVKLPASPPTSCLTMFYFSDVTSVYYIEVCSALVTTHLTYSLSLQGASFGLEVESCTNAILSNAPNNTTTTTTTMLRNFNDSSSNMRRPVCYRPTVKRFLTFHQLRRSGSALQPDRRARHCPYDPTCPLLHSPRHQHGSISYRNFGR